MTTQNKIEEITNVLSSMSVSDLVALVKSLEDVWGVSAAAQFAAAPAASGAAPAGGAEEEESSTKSIVLKKVSADQKVATIKVLMKILGVGLSAAKAMVEKVMEGNSEVLKPEVSKDEAKKIHDELATVGAVAEEQ